LITMVYTCITIQPPLQVYCLTPVIMRNKYNTKHKQLLKLLTSKIIANEMK
jgi:hypothetical protein